MRRGGGMQSGVYLDAARHVKVPIHLAFSMTHLERKSVVDPVTHLVCLQRAVRNRRGERKLRGIQLRQIDVEVHRDSVAREHRRKLVTFTNRVRTREVDTEMIP